MRRPNSHENVDLPAPPEPVTITRCTAYGIPTTVIQTYLDPHREPSTNKLSIHPLFAAVQYVCNGSNASGQSLQLGKAPLSVAHINLPADDVLKDGARRE